MALFLFLVHTNAALRRDRRRVDPIHVLRPLQQAGDGCVTYQLGFGLRKRAAVDNVDRVNAGFAAALARLRKKRSQPPGEVNVGSELNVLLAAQRRNVDGVLHDALLEVLAHLMRDLDANGLLRLSRGSGDVRRENRVVEAEVGRILGRVDGGYSVSCSPGL